METDYRIEKQLARLDSDLHGRYREFVTPGYLSLAESRAQCISYLYALSDHGIYMAAGAGSDAFFRPASYLQFPASWRRAEWSTAWP